MMRITMKKRRAWQIVMAIQTRRKIKGGGRDIMGRSYRRMMKKMKIGPKETNDTVIW
jgi:hypothetical protein